MPPTRATAFMIERGDACSGLLVMPALDAPGASLREVKKAYR